MRPAGFFPRNMIQAHERDLSLHCTGSKAVNTKPRWEKRENKLQTATHRWNPSERTLKPKNPPTHDLSHISPLYLWAAMLNRPSCDRGGPNCSGLCPWSREAFWDGYMACYDWFPAQITNSANIMSLFGKIHYPNIHGHTHTHIQRQTFNHSQPGLVHKLHARKCLWRSKLEAGHLNRFLYAILAYVREDQC